MLKRCLNSGHIPAAAVVILFAIAGFQEFGPIEGLERYLYDLKASMQVQVEKVRDRIDTPRSGRMPEGLQADADYVTGNILNRRPIYRAEWFRYLETGLLLVLSGIYIFLFHRSGQTARLCWVLGLGSITLLSGFFLFITMQWWIKAAYAVSCILTLYILMSLKELLKDRGANRAGVESGQVFEFLPGPDPGDIDSAIPEPQETPDHPEEAQARTGTLTPASPSRVGRYKIVRELGRGPMGQVYKAIDPRFNRPLAVKTIRFSDQYETDILGDIKARFLKEAEIAGRLIHPAIVTVYDAGEDGDLTFLAMEYLEGKNLEKLIEKDNLLPLINVLYVVARVAEALDFAHRTGVIHRNIKPANIMLLDNGEVKVIDFGTAKALSSLRTRTGLIPGTPNYMSPEQIMGQKIDHRSDIFSLGVLFYQLLTGELPFQGGNLGTLLHRITRVEHWPVQRHNPGLPRACDQIIAKALAKNPDQRFQTAEKMAGFVKLLGSKVIRLEKMREAGRRPDVTG